MLGLVLISNTFELFSLQVYWFYIFSKHREWTETWIILLLIICIFSHCYITFYGKQKVIYKKQGKETFKIPWVNDRFALDGAFFKSKLFLPGNNLPLCSVTYIKFPLWKSSFNKFASHTDSLYIKNVLSSL